MNQRQPFVHTLIGMLFSLLLTSCVAPSTIPSPTSPPAITPLPLANDALSKIAKAATPGVYDTPIDATPDPDGKQIYFTANSSDGPNIFSVPTAGGNVVALTQSGTLVEPRGLAISRDGAMLYVADQASMGQVVGLPITGGTPNVVPGSNGLHPRALAVAREGNSDILYITGMNPANQQPAVLRLPANGGEALVIASGAPMVEPSGITIAQDGTLYIADRSASGEGRGSLFRIQNGTIVTLASNFLTAGQVVGVTMTYDEKTLLVSSLAEENQTAQALIYDVVNQTQARFNKIIGENIGAGGLQRAYNLNLFAWIDSEPPIRKNPIKPPAGSGAVYVLEP